jgi:benzoate membrane transport protein
MANLSAGLSAGLFYLFGSVPIFLSASDRLGLTSREQTSWFFVIFMTSAIASLLLSLALRMPVPIGWSAPGLVFLATMSDRYSHAEMVGAIMAAGALMVALGLAGVADQLMRWLPLPIVMGMFAGNVLAYVTGVFSPLNEQPWTIGAAIGGYIAARAFGRAWCPPMLGAVTAGILATTLTRQVNTGVLHWTLPEIAVIGPEFHAGSLAALTMPLVVMAIGMGNLQGFGFLATQGYRPPVSKVTILMGITTMINAILGGHVSSIQNNGAPVLGGPEAGPREHRYVAVVIASVIAIGVALCAATVGTLLGLLPSALVPALAGLALMTSMQEALKKATQSDLSTGAFFALVVAGSGMSIAGIGPALWALVGGLVVSLLVERPAFLDAWRGAPHLHTEGASPLAHASTRSRGVMQPASVA